MLPGALQLGKFVPLRLSSRKTSDSALPKVISSNIEITRLTNRGDLDAARQLFDGMPQRTVVSWNAIISGYSKWGRHNDSLAVLSLMHRSNTRLNETTFSSALGACSRSGYFGLGKQLHCHILKLGYEDFDLVGSALLNLYISGLEIDNASELFQSLHLRNPLLWNIMLVGLVKCNRMSDAFDLFERMPSRDIVSWTALISSYSGNSSISECGRALEEFVRLIRSGDVMPNEFTYDSILRACAKLEAIDFGKAVHCCLIKCGFESDRSTKGALILFYCNCEEVYHAYQVFGKMSNPCLTTSNAMVQCLVSLGKINDAEKVFRQMPERDAFTYNQMIKAYAQVGRIADAKSLFDEMPCKNIVSLNTMMSVYHRSGDLEQAQRLFERIKEENNTVTWNSMISGYVQNDQPTEALKLFALMQRASVVCSRSTFSALLRASAAIGTLKQGKMLHAHLCKSPFEFNVYVGTSLVDMYAKCGSISDAKSSFLHISSPNVASWTALICGLAQHAEGVEAIRQFGRMIKNGIGPNEVTFVGLILACDREAMVDEGMGFFYCMEKNYGFVPTVEHYACVVDLLGRSGCLKEAEEFILNMPIEADTMIWGSLLNACWFFMDLEVGERVCWRMLCLNTKLISAYVVMSNIYAKLGRWEEMMMVRKKIRGLRVKKDPGCSWIEVGETVHVFCVEDRCHPQRNTIHSILDDLAANVYSCSDLHCDFCCYQKADNLSF
ncbi:Pentatricopeptide repeat-containing protein [Apostasia shenzhenica]|uniref:Pentatricopeptide repeat-containing protein n=1 Tax=Apostasia shenzhenica TaxID=1088818 RepID=A0A2I0BFY7_9ASPA|nr:Pentatricopeptide repeat-containing protein [Apostasia shenzhenica]